MIYPTLVHQSNNLIILQIGKMLWMKKMAFLAEKVCSLVDIHTGEKVDIKSLDVKNKHKS